MARIEDIELVNFSTEEFKKMCKECQAQSAIFLNVDWKNFKIVDKNRNIVYNKNKGG